MAFAGTRTRGPDCGCCDTCNIIADDFNRADSSSLGANWNEGIYDGEIASNKLKIDTADQLILSTATSLCDSVTVTVSADSAGAQARVIAGYTAAGFGGPHFSIAEWEFGASDGTLRIYNSSGGVETLAYGPFVLPGLGVGEEVRIKICWGGSNARVQIIDPATDDIIFLTGRYSSIGTGYGHGVGTGDVPSGGVYFDDYTADKTRDASSVCPTCLSACHECTSMCARFPDGITGDACTGLSGTDHILEGGTSGPTTSSPVACMDGLRLLCAWQKLQVGNLSGLIYSDAFLFLHQGASDHWYLTLLLRTGSLSSSSKADYVWEYDLGAEIPDCSIFAHSLERLESCDDIDIDVGTPQCGNLSGNVSITSGTICDYYPTGGDCCAGDTLPAVLYLTTTGYGGTPDDPIRYRETGDGFEYYGADAPAGVVLIIFYCFRSGPVTELLLDFGGGGTVTMTMTIHSCSPFHATGSDPGTGYTAEITE